MADTQVQISGRVDVITDPLTGSRAEFAKTLDTEWPNARAKMLAEYDRLQKGEAPGEADPT